MNKFLNEFIYTHTNTYIHIYIYTTHIPLILKLEKKLVKLKSLPFLCSTSIYILHIYLFYALKKTKT
jgi:hypothetical protein